MKDESEKRPLNWKFMKLGMAFARAVSVKPSVTDWNVTGDRMIEDVRRKPGGQTIVFTKCERREK